VSLSAPVRGPAAPLPNLHLPSLDGIRAVSFLLVFLAHAGLNDIVPGGFGVTVFFFLSGYLITTLLRIEFDTYKTISLRQFYLRRALRILPPFYLVLALSVLAASVGVLPDGFRGSAVATQALHFANYRIALHGSAGMPAGTGVYWSLAVEEHFYLLFPMFFVALRRAKLSARSQVTFVWGICALVLVWRCVLVLALHSKSDRTYMATDTRVDSILFGCALAIWGNPALDGLGKLSESTYKWILLPAGCAILIATFAYRAPIFRETLRYTLQGIALYPLFVVAVRWPTWGPFRLFNVRPIAFVGVLSYSLYLVHHVVLSALEPRVPGGLFRGVLALALSGGLAWTSYKFVEKPCALLRKKLTRGTKPAGPPELATQAAVT
jgi:peptidoglycan/LPS O-acetylase OafA/YrhL